METKLPIIALYAAIGIMLLGLMGIVSWLIHNDFLLSAVVILPSIVCTIAMLTLLEYILNVKIGIDELFFHDDFSTPADYYPGRMSPIEAINVLLIGSGLFLLNKQKTAAYQFFYLSCIAFIEYGQKVKWIREPAFIFRCLPGRIKLKGLNSEINYSSNSCLSKI